MKVFVKNGILHKEFPKYKAHIDLPTIKKTHRVNITVKSKPLLIIWITLIGIGLYLYFI
jgi:hypothetical protein